MENPFEDKDHPLHELYERAGRMVDKMYDWTERKVPNFRQREGDEVYEVSCIHCQHFYDVAYMQCANCMYQRQ